MDWHFASSYLLNGACFKTHLTEGSHDLALARFLRSVVVPGAASRHDDALKELGDPCCVSHGARLVVAFEVLLNSSKKSV